MNYPWQQPIRPLEVLISPNEEPSDLWSLVLFIRPRTTRGWEVITHSGVVWTSDQTMIRYSQADE